MGTGEMGAAGKRFERACVRACVVACRSAWGRLLGNNSDLFLLLLLFTYLLT